MYTFDKKRLQMYELALRELMETLKYRHCEKNEDVLHSKINSSMAKLEDMIPYLKDNCNIQLDSDIEQLFSPPTVKKLCNTMSINIVTKTHKILKSHI